jgi:hypothetical protein
MVVDLSLLEKAEQIQQWLAVERRGYTRLHIPYTALIDARGLGMQYIGVVAYHPTQLPEHFTALVEAFATLKLIGE